LLMFHPCAAYSRCRAVAASTLARSASSAATQHTPASAQGSQPAVPAEID
jgi:hypothetical protein